MWWTRHQQVSVILTIYALVWYCPFWSTRNQFCVIQFILIFFLCTMLTQCPWFVHVCSWYGSSLLFQELWLLLSCSRCFFRTNIQCSCFFCCCCYCMVYAVVMHSVDMGRFFLPLCSIIWCRLLDRLQHKPYIHK